MTVPIRPSPRCRALLLELSRYLDQELTPARRRTVERHIDACACCGTMAARLRRTVAACRAEGKRQTPRAVMSRAAKRVRALIAREATRLDIALLDDSGRARQAVEDADYRDAMNSLRLRNSDLNDGKGLYLVPHREDGSVLPESEMTEAQRTAFARTTRKPTMV